MTAERKPRKKKSLADRILASTLRQTVQLGNGARMTVSTSGTSLSIPIGNGMRVRTGKRGMTISGQLGGLRVSKHIKKPKTEKPPEGGEK